MKNKSEELINTPPLWQKITNLIKKHFESLKIFTLSKS